MKKKSFHLALIALFALGTLNAQENDEKIEQLKEVVVTATKFAIKKEKIGKVIYQIKPEELANLKGKSIVEVLDNLAGIQINGANNSDTKNKSTYIRGGRSRQVLVMIDGVPVSDPTGITNSFDLRLLALSQIESIEVMNGSASTLYGSGAATGVINIILKKAAKETFKINYGIVAGTNNSQDDSDLELGEISHNASINGSLNDFEYFAAFNTVKTDNLSEASDENSATAFEEDVYKATNTYVKLGYHFSERLKIGAFANFDKFDFDYDAGRFSDSDINNGETEQKRFGLTSDYTYTKGQFKVKLSTNTTDRFIDSYNGWTNATDHFEYTGKTTSIEAVNNYKFSNQVQLITGLSYIKQSNETNSPYGNIDDDKANYNTVDPYVSIVYNGKSGLNMNFGTRINVHSEYGTNAVVNINPSYNFTNNFRIISSYSTAFIAPSTYQLFSQYGNLDLTPEENKTIEGGFVYTRNTVEFSSVFFYREESDAIILPDFITYRNAESKIFARGIESQLNYSVTNDLKLNLGYTYTNKSADIDYIPKNKFSANVSFTGINNTYLALNYKNVSSRYYFDQWGTGENIKLDAYGLLDFYTNYELLKDKISVFAQVNNIFNEDYVETIGYTTKGRNFKFGVNFTF